MPLVLRVEKRHVFSHLRPPIHIFLILLFNLIFISSKSQQTLEDSLIRNCQSANTDLERIERFGRLSDYYYANKNFTKGDSLIEKQIMMAEATLDQKLITLVLFGNAGYRSTGASTLNRAKNTLDYIKRALAYARTNDLPDYLAIAYSNLAALNIIDGKSDEAFKNASLAFTTALNTDNDSAKVICAIQLGNVYLQKTDFLTAFKTFTNATNIAQQHKDESLFPPIMHALALLYKKLGKEDVAKNYIFRSLAIHKKSKNFAGEIFDDIELAKVSNYTAAKDYLQQAIMLADSVHDVKQKIDAEKILFSYELQKEKPAITILHLDSRPELKNVILNTGPDYLSWMMAEIYLYGEIPDSALIYFRKAESSFNAGYDLTSRKGFFGEYAQCLKKVNDIPNAISYFQHSFELARSASNLVDLRNFSSELKDLYQLQGDYKQAFAFSQLFENYKDSVDQLKQERDLALMEINIEAKEQARQVELAKVRLERRYNLQYMMITVIVITAFVLLIMIGMFKVSTATIRIAGFLTLIFLFEFIILILDKWIHHITNGEPWKNWLIKIAIISVLLPVHHFLEKKIIHYLLSRHLISVRDRLSLAWIFGRKNKNRPKDSQDRETERQ